MKGLLIRAEVELIEMFEDNSLKLNCIMKYLIIF